MKSKKEMLANLSAADLQQVMRRFKRDTVLGTKHARHKIERWKRVADMKGFTLVDWVEQTLDAVAKGYIK